MAASYDLGTHFEKYIKAQVTSGRFTDESEVIRDALRQAEQRYIRDTKSKKSSKSKKKSGGYKRKDGFDGRSHNQANILRRKQARDRLAVVVKILRRDVREGVIAPWHTQRKTIELLINISKEHFGVGFSIGLFSEYKRLLGHLQNFSQRYMHEDKIQPTSP